MNFRNDKRWFFVIVIALAVTVVILALLQIFGVIANVLPILILLCGVLLIFQGISFWNRSKFVSYFSFAVSLFSVIVFVISLF